MSGMRAILQRVIRGGVKTEGKQETIGSGLVILLGVGENDTETDADFIAAKTEKMRIFSDENGKFNFSISDVKGEILVISQFTLYADIYTGRRPDFTKAAEPVKANKLYEYFVKKMKSFGLTVKTGVFGASMQVDIINDGPVTIVIDSKQVRGKHENT